MAEREKPPMPPDEPEPTDEEIAASQRLRDALDDPSIESADADLARSLHAAFAPEPIDEDENRELAEAAAAGELAAAATLREALASGVAKTAEAELAHALAVAWNPKALSEAEHRAIVEAAIAKVTALRPRGNVIRVAFGVTVGALALAAAFVLVIRAPKEAQLAHARSTQPLFGEPFKSGEASVRIDRIALARAGDFRDNRFAQWGVR
ncbi:MAG TPA: hypothetical protein VIF62_28565 [Labilithrix sp.]